MEITRTMDGLCRVLIPKKLRRVLNLIPGDVLTLSVDGGRLILEKKESACMLRGAESGEKK